ncbi:MAG: amidase domain-containing protein [Nitrososphaerota archaeon]
MIESWENSEWALQPAAMPSGTETASLVSVACSGVFECTATGSHISSGTQALIEREGGTAGGDQTVTVEAVDKYGNAESTSIAVDVPEEIVETPDCSAEPEVVSPEGAMTAGEAVTTIEATLPTAVAPSVPTTEQISGQELDPSYSSPAPNLKAEGSLTESETSVDAAGGITLKGVACIAPAETTTAVTEAHLANGDSAVFANTAPETQTLIRPTAAGTTVVQALTGEGAPTSYSWHVNLNADEKLVELPSGAAAIIRPAGEEGGEVKEVEQPKAVESPTTLNDAAQQLEAALYQRIQAESDTHEAVVAVISRPWVVLKQESIVPLEIKVEPDNEVPTEYTLTYVMPPFEPNFTPESIVWEASGGEGGGGATASAVVNARCLEESPCGTFDANSAARYAEYWGNPNHDRNPEYHDFGAENCTNFLSQIMARGGMSYMRAYEHGDGSWWYLRWGQPPENIVYEFTQSWTVANILPTHLWQYGLAVIDSSNQPSGWGKGDILAEDAYDENGVGDFNHLQFVVGMQMRPGHPREPLIANESLPESANYPHKPWFIVKERIEKGNPEGWNRVPLAVKHTVAVYGAKNAKKHDPENLYGPNGVFQG